MTQTHDLISYNNRVSALRMGQEFQHYLDNPGAVGEGHDVPLFPEKRWIRALYHLKFAQELHGVDLLRRFMADLIDNKDLFWCDVKLQPYGHDIKPGNQYAPAGLPQTPLGRWSSLFQSLQTSSEGLASVR